jgi:folate-dependent phosphoribosylglycinamide formyltransferase PurN
MRQEVAPMASPEAAPLRIIVFSTLPADGVVAVLNLFKQLGHQVPLIVTTPGPKTRPQYTYRDIVTALPAGQDVLVTSHMNLLAPMLAPLRPDLIFTASFPWRLPADVLALPRLGAVNAHPALLPRHRGPNPLFWTVLSGDTQAGLTFHRMAPAFDTGPILAQSVIEITPEDDVDTLMGSIVAAGAALFPRMLEAVARGEPGLPQPEENASYARLHRGGPLARLDTPGHASPQSGARVGPVRGVGDARRPAYRCTPRPRGGRARRAGVAWECAFALAAGRRRADRLRRARPHGLRAVLRVKLGLAHSRRRIGYGSRRVTQRF